MPRQARQHLYNDELLGRADVHGTRAAALGVVLHFNSNIEATLDAGYGYAALIRRGVVWRLVSPRQVVYHAKGFNRSHVGVAIETEGLRDSRVDGAVPARHRREQHRAMFQRPYAPEDLEAAAYYCADVLRDHCAKGATVLFHDDLNATKNDPGPAFPREAFRTAVVRIGLSEEPLPFTEMKPEGFKY